MVLNNNFEDVCDCGGDWLCSYKANCVCRPMFTFVVTGSVVFTSECVLIHTCIVVSRLLAAGLQLHLW